MQRIHYKSSNLDLKFETSHKRNDWPLFVAETDKSKCRTSAFDHGCKVAGSYCVCVC